MEPEDLEPMGFRIVPASISLSFEAELLSLTLLIR